MRSSASHDGLQQISSGGGGFSRVKNLRNLIANSPLRRRRILSQSIDSGLPTAGRGVFGVPLVTLVTSEGADVPKIIRRVVEHVDKYGLKEEGVYRINGSAKTIEKLKASFNAVGDADFTDVDVAAIAGLLKLFLRELPAPVIPPDIEAKMVDIQQKHPGEMTEQAGSLLRDCLSQLPAIELAVFKYIVNHLSRVAQHSGFNKMTAVALSIVFGPGIFHCGGGLEGMRLQGYANSVLCRFVAHNSTLFQPSSSVVSPERPTRPEPYTEHIRKKEGSPLSPEARSHERGLYAERSVDEAMDQSSDSLYFTPPSPHTLQVSSPSTPLSPTSPPLPPSSSSPSPDETPLKRQQPVKKGKHSVIRSWSADASDHPARLTNS
ncbi:Protein FAM13A, partial [Geodia barretti]